MPVPPPVATLPLSLAWLMLILAFKPGHIWDPKKKLLVLQDDKTNQHCPGQKWTFGHYESSELATL
jgi:hypothetical protein